MLFLSLLLAAASSLRVQAQGVAGIGSSGINSSDSSADPNLYFDMNAYASTIESIVSSLNSSSNNTLQDALPVKKLYGVNVS